ncbi:DnaJ domain-containing protein [Stakelama sp. CBK3Z-3]|uniref:DnaJ domain-containing protein n=1 Tax=Stakelama flava TaxID=2860338 RepID=A0ABS6XKY9_9SPHN|nr:DnaJ C-terminal domain-containing protein [Stakelama flava]MBW4330075.1 DnaJ domain-containing protein [Stakelama flava]
MADPYATLGVARGAGEAEIKKAYRKLAKELHPDRNQDNPKAAERFSQVTQAYDLLTDKDKRARFDRGEIDAEGNPTSPFGFGGGGAGGPGGGGFRSGGSQFDFGGGENGDLGDIFEGLFGMGGGRSQGGGGFRSGFGGGGFGRRQQPQPKGANVAYRLRVPFEDAAALKPQRITLSDGKTIDLKLPAGVEDGTQMRLSGKGQPGPGGNGDGIVTIEVAPHSFYTREGDNIRLDLPITLKEAVLGAKVRVPTVDGAVMLTVPAGSSSGKVLRLKARGFHKKGGGRGDQLVTLMVEIPANDAGLKQFVENWDGAGADPRSGLGV